MRSLHGVRRHSGLEPIAALEIIAEHVEAGACRRQQNHIAGLRMRDRASHRDFERRRKFDRRGHA